MKNQDKNIETLPSGVGRAVSRRSFLKSSALSGGGLLLSFSWFSSAKAAEKMQELNLPEQQWSELTAYIKITSDNVVKILCPNPEFGQNVMTSLPMIAAEELDVDWKNVVVEMGPHDNVKLGPQFTGGSNSVRMYWAPLRNAGASARHRRSRVRLHRSTSSIALPSPTDFPSSTPRIR